MKKIALLIFLLSPVIAAAQQSHIYTDGEYAINAYDVVAYFSGQPAAGDKEKYTYEYDGVRFSFSTQENRSVFEKDPKKYIPQYGGHCSFAMATRGKKVSPDPEVFEVRDGKLYLFHRAKGLEKWLAGDTDKLKTQADTNWKKLTGN